MNESSLVTSLSTAETNSPPSQVLIAPPAAIHNSTVNEIIPDPWKPME